MIRSLLPPASPPCRAHASRRNESGRLAGIDRPHLIQRCRSERTSSLHACQSQIQREALNLPPRERIELVVELWDSLSPDEIPVPEWQRDVIRERLAALDDARPEERSAPWETVRQRVFADEPLPCPFVWHPPR